MTEEEKKVDGQTAEPAAQKKKKKWPIVVGVVVAVLVVAGAGFWVWHEQPSFCNAICHTPPRTAPPASVATCPPCPSRSARA